MNADPANETKLTAAAAKAYYDKIKVCYEFKPTIIVVGSSKSIECSFGKFEEFDESKKYDMSKRKMMVGKKLAFEKINEPYLYHFSRLKGYEMDDMDHQFVSGALGVKRLDILGLHSYGFLPNTFSPKLIEVIHLLSTQIGLGDLAHIKRLYVTTDTYPSDVMADCIDVTSGKHKGITACYIVS